MLFSKQRGTGSRKLTLTADSSICTARQKIFLGGFHMLRKRTPKTHACTHNSDMRSRGQYMVGTCVRGPIFGMLHAMDGGMDEVTGL